MTLENSPLLRSGGSVDLQSVLNLPGALCTFDMWNGKSVLMDKVSLLKQVKCLTFLRSELFVDIHKNDNYNTSLFLVADSCHTFHLSQSDERWN